jgi:hypothetical protein
VAVASSLPAEPNSPKQASTVAQKYVCHSSANPASQIPRCSVRRENRPFFRSRPKTKPYPFSKTDQGTEQQDPRQIARHHSMAMLKLLGQLSRSAPRSQEHSWIFFFLVPCGGTPGSLPLDTPAPAKLQEIRACAASATGGRGLCVLSQIRPKAKRSTPAP